MPANTVYVGRPGLFGNPFTGERALESYREWFLRHSCPVHVVAKVFGVQYVASRKWQLASVVVAKFQELRGKNLSCWCAPGCECHADVLLELANEVES